MTAKRTELGERLIQNWLLSKKRVMAAKLSLEAAESEVKYDEEELGKWLVPKDAAAGESFCVWYYDSLIQADCVPKENLYAKFGEFYIHVQVRSCGRSLIKL